MFVESTDPAGYVELDEEGLAMFNAFITQPGGDTRTQSFALHAILAGAQFNVEVARMIVLAIADTMENGVDKAIQNIHNAYDQTTGADRVEQALEAGIL